MSIPFSKIKTYLELTDTMPFGKYQGLTLARVVEDDPRYVARMCSVSTIFFMSEEAHGLLDRKIAKPIDRPSGNQWKYCTPGVYHNDIGEDPNEWDAY